MEWLNKDVTIYDLINDHYRLSLWGLRCINIEKTWGLCDEKKLSEVIVGLIDSGVEAEHEDLNGNVIEGYNFIHNSRDTCDEFGHGTNVAGVIAAKKNNGVGIAGVADGVKIVPLKVVNKNGKAHIMDVVRAIYWAIENNVHIINLSMGVEVISSDEMNLVRLAHINALKVAISKAIENSIIIISSAGNNGEDSIDFPASLNSVIAVGSVGVHKVNDTFILEKSEFNNSGKKDIIYAPGEDIYTTFINNTYSHTKGTSIAAGFVTGIVAYMKLIDPKLNQEKAKELIFKSAHIISNHKEEIPFINADNIMISMWREKVNK